MTSPSEQVQKAQHFLDDLSKVVHVTEHVLPDARPAAAGSSIEAIEQRIRSIRSKGRDVETRLYELENDGAERTNHPQHKSYTRLELQRESLLDQLNDAEEQLQEAQEREDSGEGYSQAVPAPAVVTPSYTVAPMAEPQTRPAGIAFPEWMTTLAGLEPDVIDPGLARTQPCLRTELGDGVNLVFQRGVLGPLNTEQEGLYCAQGYTDLTLTDDQRNRLRQIRTIAGTCGTRFGTTGSGDGPTEGEAPSVEGYFSCVGQELLAQGL